MNQIHRATDRRTFLRTPEKQEPVMLTSGEKAVVLMALGLHSRKGCPVALCVVCEAYAIMMRA